MIGWLFSICLGGAVKKIRKNKKSISNVHSLYMGISVSNYGYYAVILIQFHIMDFSSLILPNETADISENYSVICTKKIALLIDIYNKSRI